MAAPSFPASLFSAPVLTAINHVLTQADWACKKLQPFSGRCVHLAMPPVALTFTIDGDGRLQASKQEPDLSIALPANTPVLAMQGSERVMKVARIQGPADLADALSFVLRHLRWDIEEDISRVIGDIAARRVMQALTAFVGWQRQVAGNLADNVGEYLVHENPTLVNSAEVAAFGGGIEHLRNDLVRVETRLNLLRKKHS